jgi:hypothetical protein
MTYQLYHLYICVNLKLLKQVFIDQRVERICICTKKIGDLTKRTITHLSKLYCS